MNICPVFVNLVDLKLLKSRNVKESISMNAAHILVTLLVSKEDTSRLWRLRQPLNQPCIVVDWLVFKQLRLCMTVKFTQP